MTHTMAGRQPDSGQAAVESALTLPMVLFMTLGTIQLSLMFQARALAHYAAFRATRAGSVNFGDCQKMTDAAVASLLPAYTSFLGAETPGATPGERLANAWAARAMGMPNRNQYNPAGSWDNGYDGPIVWIFREQPVAGTVTALPLGQDVEFDDPTRPLDAPAPVNERLEVRLVFFYPMRIPFVNWVMSVIFQTYLQFGTFAGGYNGFANPYEPVNTTQWTGTGSLDPLLAAEIGPRFAAGQYLFPIQATFTMRMMTPAKASKFTTQDCPPAP